MQGKFIVTSLLILSVNILALGQNVTIGSAPTPQESAKAAWESNAIFNVGQHQSYGRLVLIGYAYQTYLRNPDSDPQQMLSVLNQSDEYYRTMSKQAQEGYRVPEGALQSIDTTLSLLGKFAGPKGQAYSEVTRDVLKLGSKGYEYLVHDSSRATAEGFETDVQEQAWTYGKKQLENAWTLAQLNPKFKLVLDTFWGKEFNALSSDSYDDIVHKNPEFGKSLELAGISTKLSGLDTSISKLKTAFDKQSTSVNAAISKNRSLLQQMDSREAAFIKAYEKQQRRNQQHQDELLERQTLIDGARAGVYLISTFIQLGGNPQLARQIATVGNATIQIAQAINTYTSTVDHLSTLGQAASSAVLAGSFLGAVMSIAALSSNQESPDEIILKEIQALSRQIAQLSEDMHARFDRVDLSLNFIFKALSDDFRELATLQRATLIETIAARKDLDQVQQSLIELRSHLDSLQMQTREYLQAGFDRDFTKTLIGCLQHSTYFPGTALSEADFQKCELDFAVRATEISKDLLSAGQTSTTTANAVEGVSSISLTDNLNYFAAIGVDEYHYAPLRDYVNALPSISAWGAGSDAYISMAIAHPEYLKQMSTEPADRMIQVGAQVEAFIKSSQNREFFASLVAEYRRRIDDYQQAVKQLQGDYQKTYVQGLDLWAGPQQKTEYKFRALSAEPNSIPSCNTRPPQSGWSTPNVSLGVPNSIAALLPEQYFTNELLNLGALEVCFSVRDFSEAASRRERINDHPAPGYYVSYDKLWQPITIRVQGWYRLKSSADDLLVFETSVDSGEVNWARKMASDGSLAVPWGGDMGAPPPGVIYQASQLVYKRWEGDKLRDKLAATAKGLASSSRDGDLKKADLKVQNSVAESLSASGREFLLKVSDGSADREHLSKLALAIDHARSALQGFTAIAFAQEMSNNDRLRSLFFGDQRLLSSSDLSGLYLQAALPNRYKRSSARQEIEIHGYSYDCNTFFEQVRQRNGAVVRLFIRAGIQDDLSKYEQKVVSRGLIGLARHDASSKDLLAAFRVKSSASDLIQPPQPGLPQKVLATDLGEKLDQFSELIQAFLQRTRDNPGEVSKIGALTRLRLFQSIQGDAMKSR